MRFPLHVSVQFCGTSEGGFENSEYPIIGGLTAGVVVVVVVAGVAGKVGRVADRSAVVVGHNDAALHTVTCGVGVGVGVVVGVRQLELLLG